MKRRWLALGMALVMTAAAGCGKTESGPEVMGEETVDYAAYYSTILDDYYYTQDLGENWYEYDESIDDWFAIPGVEDELYDNWKEYKIADLETEQTTQATQQVYYPDIRDSDYWDENDMDEYDPYDNTDKYDDSDTWDDDWDDSGSDWDSDW